MERDCCRVFRADSVINTFFLAGVLRKMKMEKNNEAGRLVLPYLEKELQPQRIPAWALAMLIAFVLDALLFPFYA
jgi:hypothetical protein